MAHDDKNRVVLQGDRRGEGHPTLAQSPIPNGMTTSVLWKRMQICDRYAPEYRSWCRKVFNAGFLASSSSPPSPPDVTGGGAEKRKTIRDDAV